MRAALGPVHAGAGEGAAGTFRRREVDAGRIEPGAALFRQPVAVEIGGEIAAADQGLQHRDAAAPRQMVVAAPRLLQRRIDALAAGLGRAAGGHQRLEHRRHRRPAQGIEPLAPGDLHLEEPAV